MLKFCLLCFSYLDEYREQELRSSLWATNFCSRCQQRLLQLTSGKRCLFEYRGAGTPQFMELVHLFEYREPLRNLILRAKVKSDVKTIESLIQVGLSRIEVQKLSEWAEIIMPIPSSLWGRCRGRFDIAYLLAQALSEKYHRILQTAPFSCHWHIKKRAMKKNRKRKEIPTVQRLSNDGEEIQNPITTSRKRILLVDDIVTTGYSMISIAEKLEYSEVKALALAEALK